MTIRITIFLLLCISALIAETPSQRVGLPLVIPEIYIPGGEVKVKPRRTSEPPLSVRILEVKPAIDGSRYDFEIHGLDPGTYDLADFLDAPEGTSISAIPLEITAGLPPGLPRPHEMTNGSLPELGGYRQTMIFLAAAWLAGLLAIILWRKKKPVENGDNKPTPPTLSERLRPLIIRAADGNIASAERAELERLVIGHWRGQHPEIAALPPAEAMVALRSDPEASPLILALERWLHARNPITSTSEIGELLAPYR